MNDLIVKKPALSTMMDAASRGDEKFRTAGACIHCGRRGLLCDGECQPCNRAKLAGLPEPWEFTVIGDAVEVEPGRYLRVDRAALGCRDDDDLGWVVVGYRHGKRGADNVGDVVPAGFVPGSPVYRAAEAGLRAATGAGGRLVGVEGLPANANTRKSLTFLERWVPQVEGATKH